MSHVICLLCMIFVWPNPQKTGTCFSALAAIFIASVPEKNYEYQPSPTATHRLLGIHQSSRFAGILEENPFRVLGVWWFDVFSGGQKFLGGSCFLGERQRVSWYRRLKYHWWYRSILPLMGMMQSNKHGSQLPYLQAHQSTNHVFGVAQLNTKNATAPEKPYLASIRNMVGAPLGWGSLNDQPNIHLYSWS